MRIKVTPRPGYTVRDPQTRVALPPEGAIKEDSSFWRRRERDGDVTIEAEAASAPAPAPKSTAKADK